MPGAKKLTRKQAAFVAHYTTHLNGSQAALHAYQTTNPDVAKVIASENLTKPNVREAVDKALESHDLTPYRIGKKISEMLDAQKDSPADYPIQAKAVDIVARLAGLYAPNQTTVRRQSISLELTEPLPIRRWIAKHGRRPTADELERLTCGPDDAD